MGSNILELMEEQQKKKKERRVQRQKSLDAKLQQQIEKQQENRQKLKYQLSKIKDVLEHRLKEESGPESEVPKIDSNQGSKPFLGSYRTQNMHSPVSERNVAQFFQLGKKRQFGSLKKIKPLRNRVNSENEREREDDRVKEEEFEDYTDTCNKIETNYASILRNRTAAAQTKRKADDLNNTFRN